MGNIRSLAFGIFSLTLVLGAAPAFSRDIGSFDRTLNVTGAPDLDVETNSGYITVRRGASNTVQIHAVIAVSDYWDFYAAEQRARQIEANPPISQNVNAIRIERLDDPAGRHLSISYEIEAPASTSLRARTGSGGQTIEDIQGPVTASTGSGGIHISRIESEVRANTGSGSIELDSIKGRVNANTGSGSIRASDLMDEVIAHTGSGSVQLQLPASGGFDLHARTGSGSVTVNPPIVMENFSSGGHDVHGRIRGGGPLIDVATGSGSVHVD